MGVCVKKKQTVFMIVESRTHTGISRIHGLYTDRERAIKRHRDIMDRFMKLGWCMETVDPIPESCVDYWQGRLNSPILGKLTFAFFIEEMELDRDYR